MKVNKERLFLCKQVAYRKEIELAKSIEKKEQDKFVKFFDRFLIWSIVLPVFIGLFLRFIK